MVVAALCSCWSASAADTPGNGPQPPHGSVVYAPTPNPTNGPVVQRFLLASEDAVSGIFALRDLQGRLISVLSRFANARSSGGNVVASFESSIPRDIPNGVYFLSVEVTQDIPGPRSRLSEARGPSVQIRGAHRIVVLR